MQILLASAKLMHGEVRSELALTQPLFQQSAESLARDMMEYDAGTIAGMLGCNSAIASQNKLRYVEFINPGAVRYPAILAYNGQAYKHLKASSMSHADLEYAQQHLWITSFLYGLLRPRDGILPYRMEGKVVLPSAGDMSLFNFWKSRLTQVLVESVKSDDGVLVHLATEEFQRLFDWKNVVEKITVVQPLFYVRKGGELKVQAVWAKSCRGAMTRFIIENRISDIESLTGFSYEGFEYNPRYGDRLHPHFIREA